MIKNGAGICDSKIAKRKYEALRANALGGTNRADEFMFFLCNGMSTWCRTLQKPCADRREMRKEISSVFAEPDAEMPTAGLVAILADAMLKSVRTADCRR